MLARQLNEHRAAMNDAILGVDGTVMQFVAARSWPCSGPRSPGRIRRRAVLVAVAMHATRDEVNGRWATQGLPPFGLGIGIDRAGAAAALLGSRGRLEYTIVGDTVNLTQRLQQWAEPGETVLSRPTVGALSAPVEAAAMPPSSWRAAPPRAGVQGRPAPPCGRPCPPDPEPTAPTTTDPTTPAPEAAP